LVLAAASLALLAASAGSAGPAAADPAVTRVMTGLDNPRGLAFGPQGALYVAEAGRGGLGLEDPFCFAGALGAMRCYGPTGAVSRFWHGDQEQVVSGLPSQARASDGNNANGPADIAMLGLGSAYVTLGLFQPVALRDQHPQLAGLGRLAQFEPSGEWRFVADIGAYEAANNPDGGLVDSNPYGLLAEPGGHVLTDASGNALLRVDANGAISTLAVFQSRRTDPPRSTDSVPTSVAIGPDGAYYVGELSGAPYDVGSANVYRVVPGEPARLLRTDDACLGGFSFVIDLAFDEAGALYVLQFATDAGPSGPGVLIRVTPDQSEPGGTCAQYRAGTRTTVVGGLIQPTSVAVGPDGAFYISDHGNSAGVGEVLRVQP
jgi:sugar lactone lactonase YvrE